MNALEYMEKSGYVTQVFVLCSDSNLLLFCYSQNEYFYTEYKEQALYLEAKQRLQRENL